MLVVKGTLLDWLIDLQLYLLYMISCHTYDSLYKNSIRVWRITFNRDKTEDNSSRIISTVNDCLTVLLHLSIGNAGKVFKCLQFSNVNFKHLISCHCFFVQQEFTHMRVTMSPLLIPSNRLTAQLFTSTTSPFKCGFGFNVGCKKDKRYW